MKLLEYEAKRLLATYQLPVPDSTLVSSPNETVPFLPCVLKSQVPIGGRGKAGGVKIVTSADEFTAETARILALDIKGFTPRTLLAEQPIAIKREFYFSLIINYDTAAIEVLAHPNGGVEVEDNNTDDFVRLPLENADEAALTLAEAFDLPDKQFLLADLLEKFKTAFIKEDMTLLEINPLILTTDSELLCGDAKIELDDATAFRHSDWQFETPVSSANFVTLNEHGSIAMIANGAGLAMATVDAVAAAGFTPANFLDIGGGANEASVFEALEEINSFQDLQGIVVNIFAGITRCDEVAKALLKATEKLPQLPPLYVRLEGTNFPEAQEILASSSLTLFSSLEETLAAIPRTQEAR